MTKGCVICENHKPFDMPKEIIESVKKNNLVIFAGAGISTETYKAFPLSFYDEVCDFLDLPIDIRNLPFPDVMSLLTEKPNGRKELVKLFNERLEYSKAFGQVENSVTRFHKELADIHQITDIITTNWDDLFELHCHALPIVTPKDFSFWDLPGRKVYKIHGSINNVGTIVADKNDYKDCYKSLNTGIVGSALKMMLATKTIVFCGYSLKDSDLLKILEILKKELGNIFPHAYIITLDNSITENSNGLTVINTDASFFLHCIKEELFKDNTLFNSKLYNYYYALEYELYEIHKKVTEVYMKTQDPQVILCMSYQDGIIDGIDRAIRLKNTGLYLCPDHLKSHIEGYRTLYNDKVRSKNYWDAAYIEGYMNTLYLPFAPDNEKLKIPMLYIYGYKEEIKSLTSFKKILKEKTHNKTAEAKMRAIMKKLNGQIPQHTAFLL